MPEKGTIVKRLITPILAAVCLLSACGGAPGRSSGGGADFDCSAWLPYWDADAALQEADAFSGSFASLVCFEAFFDPDGNWILPPQTERLLEGVKDGGTPVWLSLVNDVQQADGSIIQKSRDFLERNLLAADARSVHIVRILELVRAIGAEGLEIDYEGFKKDAQLWQAFSGFVGELYEVLGENGVRLRVVTEYGAPQYTAFPEGPVYVCMCYNLYGSHSGPGPKADEGFLKKLGENWKSMPGEVHMAFASGGYLWAEDKAERSLTEQQALQWLEEHGANPVRDRKSGALWASINADKKYTVWYADGRTLDFWRGTLQSMGYTHFDLFRLGGNTADSLTEFLGAR